MDVDGKEKVWPLPGSKNAAYKFECGSGLSYEAEEVRRCINEGKTQCETITHKESLIIANIEDEIRRQIGVVYPEDK